MGGAGAAKGGGAVVVATFAIATTGWTQEDAEIEAAPAALEEQLVVTASQTVEKLQDAPAAVSVVTGIELEQAPVRNFGDALTRMPGVNIVQLGVRDIQITPRAATSSLANGQLALVDGRTIYQDFLGFVFWDAAPVFFDDIQQIEVVRGPGSAIWGANALRGVINVRTKAPKDIEGGQVSAGFGNRSNRSAGLLFADVLDRWSYKIRAGWFEQDDWPHPDEINGAPPVFEAPTPGTRQPQLDLRADYELTDRDLLSFRVGSSGTSGLIASGIGPFDIEQGSSFSHAQVTWERGDLTLSAFANILDGSSTNVFAADPDTREGIEFDFETQVFDVNFKDGLLFGTKTRLIYGGNVRRQNMDLSLAPGGEDRTEAGAFAELQFLFNDHIWWNVGGRYDYYNYSGSVLRSPVGDPFDQVDVQVDRTVRKFSPRTSVLLRASDDHTFRIGFGQAFRTPSLIENFMSTTLLVPTGSEILAQIELRVFGTPELDPERLDSFDVSYNGTFGGRVRLSVNYYYTIGEDEIRALTQDALELPLPPPFDEVPLTSTFFNLGKVRNTGVETALTWAINRWVDVAVNHTYQRAPRSVGIEPIFIPVVNDFRDPVGVPPKHSYTTSINVDRSRFFGNVSTTYRDDAFWADILTDDFWGPSKSWFWTNARFGVRFLDERLTWSVSATNLFDNPTRTHVFGDEIGGLYTTELKLKF